MEIEKSLTIAAPIDHAWKVLLDPAAMAGCVPGTQSVQVLSDTDYLVELKVKISFISARFKVRAHVLETRPPFYLRCEGSGDDASVASSVKFVAELFLTEQDGETVLTVKGNADVFGRLGSFGLAVMTTKVDRMWEEFGTNLSAVLRSAQADDPRSPSGPSPTGTVSPQAEPAPLGHDGADLSRLPGQLSLSAGRGASERGGTHWWQRILPGPTLASTAGSNRLPTDIYVEVQRGDSVIKVVCPANSSGEILEWLKEVSR